MNKILAIALVLLTGCDLTSWSEVDPKTCVDELVEGYGLPLPQNLPQMAVYRAATQRFRGEFIVMRADITPEIQERIEASLAPKPNDRPPVEVVEYILSANRSIKWWPAAGTFKARKYSAKPQGVETFLLEVFVVHDVTAPFILFVMTPKKLYTRKGQDKKGSGDDS